MPHARYGRRFLNVAFVVTAAAALSACDVVINSMEGGRAKATQLWTRSYTLGGPDAQVEVVNVNGRIDVEAVDGTTLDVKAEITVHGGSDEAAQANLKQVEIREDASPARVRLETRFPRTIGRQGADVKYTLRVPRLARVSLETVNGVIAIVGIQGGVRAESTNGAVRGKGLANTVTASTTNGGVDIEMAGLGGDGVTLETTNGGVDLKLPAEAKATLSARCVNGGINVGTGLSFEPAGEQSRRRVDGTINGGGPPVRLETVNGGIRIGRQ